MIVHSRHAARLERRTAKAFRLAGALAPEHAKSLAQLGLEEDRIVRRMVDQRIIREARAGEFYLDEDAFREYRALVLRLVLVPAIIISLALMIYGIVAGLR